ncbi:MAG: recombination protein RecR [Deltaproteobacteria bacterium]|nr:recombination protein RecR [Deltaproteobacteria bacterium]MBW2078246.1 recombination protein RecR [Deltaproteobacteria bacterium]MBW2310954.1 recombination protein RecR [Deltaproteobacteria bacterium]RLB32205.1 MAG: recombination protein RecR [Deltaproteobacteria bacterium]
MGIYPPSLGNLIDQFSKLPGIGKKSAERLALHVLRSPRELAESLAQGLVEVKEKIRFCSICFNLTDNDPCPICTDERRANGVLCVVEGPGDQLAIEKSGAFSGRYHILQGVLSPLDGIGAEDLRIAELMSRIRKENVREVILAINPTVEGEATVSYITDLLNEKGLNVTRMALGIPLGGDLKYMDSMTIKRSIDNRSSCAS